MRGWLTVVVLMTGCGRVGFDQAERFDSTPDAHANADTVSQTSYVSEVLADAPIAYWRLESAARADDSSTFDRDAPLDGQVELAPGIVGDAVRFGGGGPTFTGGRIALPVAFPFNERVPFSIECWLYPDALTNDWRQLVQTDNWDPLGRRQGYTIEFRDDDIFFERRRDDASDSVGVYDALVAQRWVHIVATYDGDESRIYLDGAVRGSLPSTKAIASEPGIFSTISDPEYAVTGILDECAIYASALPAARVEVHHRLGANL